ncbi:Protein suppresor of gene silencing 3 [Apostasia shenzhenica]|uniref:Protein suppresor of gene silencing 3 n=1 Tax=Apostasia shenzhenica TaxID=1088818 RepID=A0A2H9ZZ55_9ASPA|nr:Protein suppresor of gene silencing 3 [Apostasia shenzhenica]
MDQNSGKTLKVTDSEIGDYETKCYLQLKSGNLKVRVSESIYRCPFCLKKKTQNYQYKHLLQHATAIGLSGKTVKVKAEHQAVAKFLQKDLVDTSNPPLQLLNKKTKKLKAIKSELFVWPWMGILVNIPTEFKNGKYVGGGGNWMKEQLSEFNPLKVHVLWNFKGHTGNAIVDFNKDWNGFKDAMAFENHFDADNLGKMDWAEKRNGATGIYGWVARAHDYNSRGRIGRHLRKHGDLKTADDITKEESQKASTLVKVLLTQIEVKKKHIEELECKYNETTFSLDKVMEERDKLHESYNNEIQRMQRLAQEHSRRILHDNQKLKVELDRKKRELALRSMQLDNLVAQSDSDARNLEDERTKYASINSSLELASLEQKKVDDDVLRLVEKQKKEKEAAIEKIIKLEKQLEAKHKLELEIQQLKGSLQVMKHLGGEDLEINGKIVELNEELKEKIEELEDLEALNQALIVKERKSNDELQEARKELISGLSDVLTNQTIVGIKRMGELNEKIFHAACMKKYRKDEAEVKAAELCSKWQDELRNPDWHPFRTISVNGKLQLEIVPEKSLPLPTHTAIRGVNVLLEQGKVQKMGPTHLLFGKVVEEAIQEEDDKLVTIKADLGDEVHNAVTMALLEMNECNPSGRYAVPELWSFGEGRKAPLKEVLKYLLMRLKTTRRKRSRHS